MRVVNGSNDRRRVLLPGVSVLARQVSEAPHGGRVVSVRGGGPSRAGPMMRSRRRWLSLLVVP